MYETMAVLVAWPALALLPGVGFLALHRVVPRRTVLAAAILWIVYAAYEYAMQRRILCSGECNIRVDLLLLYPLLLLLSLAALVAVARGRRGRP